MHNVLVGLNEPLEVKLPVRVTRIWRGLPKGYLFCPISAGTPGKSNREKPSSAQPHLPSWPPRVFQQLESRAKMLKNMQIPFLVFEMVGSSMSFIEHQVESRGAGTRSLCHYRFCVIFYSRNACGNTKSSSRLPKPFTNLCLNAPMAALFS